LQCESAGAEADGAWVVTVLVLVIECYSVDYWCLAGKTIGLWTSWYAKHGGLWSAEAAAAQPFVNLG